MAYMSSGTPIKFSLEGGEIEGDLVGSGEGMVGLGGPTSAGGRTAATTESKNKSSIYV